MTGSFATIKINTLKKNLELQYELWLVANLQQAFDFLPGDGYYERISNQIIFLQKEINDIKTDLTHLISEPIDLVVQNLWEKAIGKQYTEISSQLTMELSESNRVRLQQQLQYLEQLVHPA